MNKFEIVRDEFRAYPNVEIKLPARTTKGSAGYDICTPVDIDIKPNETCAVKTDIKAKVKDNEVLLVFIRSSVGIKKRVMLPNSVGVIDSDFYNNLDNDGNITLALYNFGTETQHFKAGDRIAQGMFVKYDVTVDDNANGERVGGIGSTNAR